MNHVSVRIIFYMLMGGGVALSAAGLAEFDLQTGDFDLASFNIYQAADNIGAIILAGMGSFAVFKKWGTK